jgi:hypothetical protein
MAKKISPLENELAGWSKYKFIDWAVRQSKEVVPLFFDEYMFDLPCAFDPGSKKWNKRKKYLEQFRKETSR